MGYKGHDGKSIRQPMDDFAGGLGQMITTGAFSVLTELANGNMVKLGR